MGDSHQEKADVLDYWRSVEYFLPQDLPKVAARANRHSPVVDVDPARGEPLPWQPGHRLQGRWAPPSNKEWRHTVFCGAIDLNHVRDLLREKFGREEFAGDVEERRLGQAPAAALVLDSAGRPLLDTEGIGSCGWAVGQTLDPGPGSAEWLVGFEAVEDVFSLLFEWLATGGGEFARQALLDVLDDDPLEANGLSHVWELLESAADKLARDAATPPQPDRATPDGFARPDSNAAGSHRRSLTAEDLRVCTQAALHLCGIQGFAAPLVRVKSEQVTSWQAAKEHGRQQEAMHQRAADRGACEPPTEQPPPPDVGEMLNSRIAADVGLVAAALRTGDCGAALRDYLSPSASTQQIQRHDLRAETGAQRVALDRTPAARWPAKTAHPLVFGQQVAVNSVVGHLGGDRSGLFAVNGPPGTGKTTLLRDLVAHVVAERARALARLTSPNAGYAAPVTWRTGKSTHTVHPLVSALTGHEIVVASANNGAVENVTTEIPGADAIAEEWADRADYFSEVGEKVLEGPSWGVLAARLGRQSNRIDFARRFWEGGPPQRQADGRWRPPGGGMDDALKRAAATGIQRWRAAVSAFNDAEREVEQLRQRRRDFVEDTHRLADLLRAAEEAPADAERAKQRRDTAQTRRREAAERHRTARDSWQMWEQSAARHAARRPAVFRRIATLNRVHREWRTRERDVQASLDRARAAEQDCARHLDKADEDVRDSERDLAAAAEHVLSTERAYTAVEESTRRGWREWDGFIPSGDVLGNDHSRELASIWGDPELTAARTRVFLAAVDLHRAFIECSAPKMRANLAVADQGLRGRQAAEAPPEGLLGAWRSLFMVVPVVSSTFSSFANQFAAFGREDLGWLLIDEAGQATPQQAVGALWRSRRAVVVGDPLQLEPICSLPYTAQEALRRPYGVEGKWVPARTSVQQLADEVTPLGTELPGPGGEPLWVGCPLRVHRRCDSPMFDISNEVAYGGMMVFGTPQRAPLERIAKSSWVDVPAAGEAREHWLESERIPLQRVLEKLRDRGQDMDEVFVVSPFSSVARVAERVAQEYGVPQGNAGTVHTTQGKETDVVVLILGGNPSRPRAKEWAAQRPNLVNVAVSRAKRRLYVIGDRAAWAKLDFFSTLADRLPSHGFTPT